MRCGVSVLCVKIWNVNACGIALLTHLVICVKGSDGKHVRVILRQTRNSDWICRVGALIVSDRDASSRELRVVDGDIGARPRRFTEKLNMVDPRGGVRTQGQGKGLGDQGNADV